MGDMKQNILIIGNGFDLYHKLPTRYTDFLAFIRDWEHIRYSIEPIKQPNDFEFDLPEQLKEESIKTFSQNVVDGRIYQKIKELIENNTWIDIFVNSKQLGANWIDFEKEIERFLVSVDNGTRGGTIGQNLNEYMKRQNYEDSVKWTQSIYHDNATEVLQKLKEDLEKLIDALDIYFSVLIDKAKIHIYSKQIQEIKPSVVINFNYTNTYDKIYSMEQDKIKSLHIHGEIEEQNIVLGVKDDNLSKIRYIYFTKYFQRIQKRTGLYFSKWLHTKPKIGNVNMMPVRNFFVMGHSLDNTDGDIFRDIVNSEYTGRVLFYYHTQEAYEQQVINLVKMFGKDKLLELIDENKIDFVELEEGIPIEKNE